MSQRILSSEKLKEIFDGLPCTDDLTEAFGLAVEAAVLEALNQQHLEARLKINKVALLKKARVVIEKALDHENPDFEIDAVGAQSLVSEMASMLYQSKQDLALHKAILAIQHAINHADGLAIEIGQEVISEIKEAIAEND